MSLNDSESHFKVILFLKDFYNKNWGDSKVATITKWAKQYKLPKFKKIVARICEEEITLPPNPVPLFREYIHPKLDKKDADILISNVHRKILTVGRYRTPAGEDFNAIEKQLIADFGGWVSTCDNFDEFKWFVRNSIKSGVDLNGNYSKNALKGKHEIENERIQGRKKDARALNKIISKAKENKDAQSTPSD